MKLRLHPVWILVVYIMAQGCLEASKEFNMVGAANLRKYDFYDWLILGVGVAGTVFITIKALLDTSVQDYKNGKDTNAQSNSSNGAGTAGG